MQLAETAGFGSDALKDFTAKFQINLKDLSPEDAIKKYQEEFGKIEESMAKAVIGTSGYRRENETNVQTLTRLSAFMGGINDAFEKLGFETYKLELSSIDAAQSFVDLFGGIDKFNQAMGFFYDNFFTAEEKTLNLTKDLTEEFEKLNKPLPETREAFKAMVIAAKEAGDNELVVNLMKLQYGVAALREESTLAGPAVEELAESIEQAYQRLKNSSVSAEDIAKERIDLERKLFELTASSAELEADRRNAIHESNRSIYDQIKAIEDKKIADQKAAEVTKKAAEEMREAIKNSVSDIVSDISGALKSSGAESAYNSLYGITSAVDAQSKLLVLGLNNFNQVDTQAQSKALEEAALNWRSSTESFQGYIKRLTDRVISVKDVFIDAEGAISRFMGTFRSDVERLNAATKLLSENFLWISNAPKQLNKVFDRAMRPEGTATEGNIVARTIAKEIEAIGLTFNNATAARTESTQLANLTGRQAGLNQIRAGGIKGIAELESLQYSFAITREATRTFDKALLSLNQSFTNGSINSEELASITDFVTKQAEKLGVKFTELDRTMQRLQQRSQLVNAAVNSAEYYFEQINQRVQEMNKVSREAGGSLTTLVDTLGRLSSVSYAFGTSARFIGKSDPELALKSEAVSIGARFVRSFLNTQAGAKAEDDLSKNAVFEGLNFQKIGPIFDTVSAFNVEGLEEAFLRLTNELDKGSVTVDQYSSLLAYARDIFLDLGSTIKGTTKSLDDLISFLDDEVQSMTPNFDTSLMDRRYAQSELEKIISSVQNDGLLPTVDQIRPFVETIKAPSDQFFSTVDEYLADFYRSKYALSDLRNFAQERSESNLTDVVDSLADLKVEVEGLRSETRSVAVSSNTTAKLLTRVTQDGESLTVTNLA